MVTGAVAKQITSDLKEELLLTCSDMDQQQMEEVMLMINFCPFC